MTRQEIDRQDRTARTMFAAGKRLNDPTIIVETLRDDAVDQSLLSSWDTVAICTLSAFLKDNPTITADEEADIRAMLRCGCEWRDGGGAAPIYRICGF